MQPRERIELDEDEYVRTYCSISEGFLESSSEISSNCDTFTFGVAEGYDPENREWLSFVDATGEIESGRTVSSSIGFDEETAKKVVERLADFWNWEGEGYEKSDG